MFALKGAAVGIDISDRTIELVELKKKGGSAQVRNISRAMLPKGVVVQGRIVEEEKLQAIVTDLFTKAKPKAITTKDLVLSIPESQVYIQACMFTDVGKGTLDDIIARSVKEGIPIDDAVYTYKIISHKNGETNVVIVAASNDVLEEWQQFFHKMGYEIPVFDVQGLALLRALFPKKTGTATCIVDIGATTTNIFLYTEKGVVGSYVIHISGDTITQAFATEKKIDIDDAEKQKKKVSLAKSKAITKQFQELATRLETIISRYEKRTEKKIAQVILVGGASAHTGADKFLQKALGRDVIRGHSPLFTTKKHDEYLQATGMAMRVLQKKWRDEDVVLAVRKEKKKLVMRRAKKRKPKEPLTTGQEDKERSIVIPIAISILVVGLLAIGYLIYLDSTKRTSIEEETIKQLERVQEAEVTLDALVPELVPEEEEVFAIGTSTWTALESSDDVAVNNDEDSFN